MKDIKSLIVLVLVFLSFTTVNAQDKTATPPAEVIVTPETSNSLTKALGIFVFPAKGQDKNQQDTDQLECYRWAKEQTGYDPMNPTKVEVKAADTNLDGSAVVGAAGGAAAGAAIGAIAGDAGKGAAIGAVVGGLRGRRARKYGDHKEQQHNEAEAKAAMDKMESDFIKAFSVCLEAKEYTVK